LDGFAFGPGSCIAEDYSGSRITTTSLDARALRATGPVVLVHLPTDPHGLALGQLWNNHGTLSIVSGDRAR
jgi:hypothetical protein